MSTHLFACRTLPKSNTEGILTAVNHRMAQMGLAIEVRALKLVFYFGYGAPIVQGYIARGVALFVQLQTEACGCSIILSDHASCHQSDKSKGLERDVARNKDHPPPPCPSAREVQRRCPSGQTTQNKPKHHHLGCPVGPLDLFNTLYCATTGSLVP